MTFTKPLLAGSDLMVSQFSLSAMHLTPEPQTDTTFSDNTAGTKTRRYYIVAVDALGQEGFPSSPVWFQREWQTYYTPFIGEWHQ